MYIRYCWLSIQLFIYFFTGPITMEDVLFILPFRNEVERLTLSGQTILEALEYSASRYDELSPRGAFLVLGGKSDDNWD